MTKQEQPTSTFAASKQLKWIQFGDCFQKKKISHTICLLSSYAIVGGA